MSIELEDYRAKKTEIKKKRMNSCLRIGLRITFVCTVRKI